MSQWSCTYANPWDDTNDFTHAVSLLAALEGCTSARGWAGALPYLGMARSELVEFGRRLPPRLLDTPIPDFQQALHDLTCTVQNMLATSTDLERSLHLRATLTLLINARRHS